MIKNNTYSFYLSSLSPNVIHHLSLTKCHPSISLISHLSTRAILSLSSSSPRKKNLVRDLFNNFSVSLSEGGRGGDDG